MRPRTAWNLEVSGQRRDIAIWLLAGAVAGLGGWALGERMRIEYMPPIEQMRTFGKNVTDVTMDEALHDNALVQGRHLRNFQAHLSILGLALGLTFGGLGAKLSSPRSLHSPFLGAGLGAIGGLAAASAREFAFQHWVRHDEMDSALKSMLVHGVGWVVLGAALGLAVGLASLSWRKMLRAATGGLLGGLLAATCFEALYPLVCPAVNLDPINSTSRSRLLAALILGVSISLCLILFGRLRLSRVPDEQAIDAPKQIA